MCKGTRLPLASYIQEISERRTAAFTLEIVPGHTHLQKSLQTMERLICTQLRSYLETNSLLNPNQFGFRSGRNTIDQLLLVYNTVSKNTDLGGVTNVNLFDFSKAFDVVCHDIMISKLKAIGLGG